MGCRTVSARRLVTTVLLGASLAACDALLVEPQPSATEVRLSVTGPLAAPGDLGDLSEALQAVREIHFELIHEGGSRDTTVAPMIERDTVRVRLALHPEEARGWLEIHAELRISGAQPLFRGVAVVQAYGVGPSMTVPLSPVAYTVTGWSLTTMTALGDTVALSGVVRFANNLPIEGAEVTWASDVPTVAGVVGGNLLVSRGNGTASITASSLGAETSQTLRVSQTPVVLSGVGPADTTVALGATFQARPFGKDANDYPLLPGANVQWAGRGAVSVESGGRVHANAVGTGFVDVTYGEVTHTATVTVTP